MIVAEVSIAGITETGLLFNAARYTGEVLGENMTLDNLTATDWHFRAIYPLQSDMRSFQSTEVNTIQPARKVLHDLIAMRKELEGLREEKFATCNTARYNELQSPTGPIRNLENRITVYELAARVLTEAALGVDLRTLRDLNL